tara:strand:- start:7 stop:114 length:108 start_codon:yes stop_codon:yes gene_type:complete
MREYTANDTLYSRKGEVDEWEVVETIGKISFIHDS